MSPSSPTDRSFRSSVGWIDNGGVLDRNLLIVSTGLVLAVFLVVSFLPERKKSAAGPDEAELSAERAEVDVPSGAYPVPPMPAQGAVRDGAEPLTFREEI